MSFTFNLENSRCIITLPIRFLFHSTLRKDGIFQNGFIEPKRFYDEKNKSLNCILC